MKKKSGFILLDTLMGLAILSIVVVGLSTGIQRLQAFWDQVRSQNTALYAAEHTLHQIITDQHPTHPQLQQKRISNGILKSTYTLPSGDTIEVLHF